MAEAERLDGQIDVGCLGYVELVLQRADALIILQEETALHITVMPFLERWKTFLLVESPAYTHTN